VHHVAQWVTPHGSPRRYDTPFSVTGMPEGQVPLHDNDEAVNHEWVRAGNGMLRGPTGHAPTLS